MLALMERAPLRPVPRRPDGPVEPSEAIAHVDATLPAADESARAALALVEIAGRSRAEAATTRGLSSHELADALARGRKALRRSLYPLPGSGWCERAERMISDRMDGALEPPGPARLDAHLGNCPRCVEHELRLAQAIDAMVAGFVEARPAPAPHAAPAQVRPAVIRAARPELRVLPFGVPTPPTPMRIRLAEAPTIEPPPVEEPPLEEPPAEPPVEVPPVEPPEPIEPPEPAEPLEPPAAIGAPLAWRAMYALAVLLAVLTVVVTALGVAGVDPF